MGGGGGGGGSLCRYYEGRGGVVCARNMRGWVGG